MLDLAVAFVIGAAFVTVVGALTDGLIQPVVKELLGGGVSGGTIELSPGNVIDLSLIVNATITFLITAAVVYFVFVLPMNTYQAHRDRHEASEDAAVESELDVLKEIRDRLGSGA